MNLAQLLVLFQLTLECLEKQTRLNVTVDNTGSNTACIIDVMTIAQKMLLENKTFFDILKSVFP